MVSWRCLPFVHLPFAIWLAGLCWTEPARRADSPLAGLREFPMYLRFRRLFEYDDESNAKAISAIRSARAGAEQERAIGIMAHVLIARREWLRRMGGPGAVGGAAMTTDFFPKGFGVNDLEHLLSEVRAWWQEWLASLSEAKLRQAYDYTSSDGKHWTTHIEDSLTHVLLHGAYHRGQVALMVKSGGGEPQPTDFIINARKPAG